MNNKNKILIICLSLLLALSMGFALFSDTITINGTATAKGSFDVTATCETGISSKFGTVESLGLSAEGGYENDSCSVVDDAVSLKSDFLYPGARRYYTIKFTNTGTIDVVYDNANYTVTRQLCIADNMEGNNKTCTSTGSLGNYTTSWKFDALGMEDPDGNLLTQTEMAEYVDFTNMIITVPPNYSFYIYYTSTINHKTDVTDGGEMYAEFTTVITMPFNQVVSQ